MQETDFVTFDNYVQWVQDGHQTAVTNWDRDHKVAEIVRHHGGAEFSDFGCCDSDFNPAPELPDIPARPNMDNLHPYCRVKLCGRGIDYLGYECLERVLMLIIEAADDYVEGYVFSGGKDLGRLRVSVSRIIESWPPFEPGQADPVIRDDGLFGVTDAGRSR